MELFLYSLQGLWWNVRWTKSNKEQKQINKQIDQIQKHTNKYMNKNCVKLERNHSIQNK